MARDYTLFSKVLDAIHDGMQIAFTEQNVADGDNFLIFNDDNEQTIVTFHTKSVPYWVEFNNDEPMLLENCPDSFLRSIIKNI